MMRHTGGAAWGATSTKSRCASTAMANASLMGITPTCAPSALISRTSGTLICSLILTLCCFWMAVTS